MSDEYQAVGSMSEVKEALWRKMKRMEEKSRDDASQIQERLVSLHKDLQGLVNDVFAVEEMKRIIREGAAMVAKGPTINSVEEADKDAKIWELKKEREEFKEILEEKEAIIEAYKKQLKISEAKKNKYLFSRPPRSTRNARFNRTPRIRNEQVFSKDPTSPTYDYGWSNVSPLNVPQLNWRDTNDDVLISAD